MEEIQEKKHSYEKLTSPGSSSNDDVLDEKMVDTMIEIPQISSLPFKQVIDAATFSPDGKFLATYASKEGKLVIWKVSDKRFEETVVTSHRLEPIWHSNPMKTDLKPRNYMEERESFASSFTQKILMTNIDFALSNEGKFVALSLVKLPQEGRQLAFELVQPPPDKYTKFYTYIVRTALDRPVFRKSLMKLTGTIKFTEDNKSFIISNIEHNNFDPQNEENNCIFVISTNHWKVQHKLIIDTFSETLQVIPHPWSQMKIVKNSLLPGHFIFVEQWDTALLWSLTTGQLVSRFKCLAKDSFLDADSSPTLFALSHDQQMLATWTSKGVLTIYLCEGGLTFASSLHNDDKKENSLDVDSNVSRKEIFWLEGDEHIITINSTGKNSTDNCVQIWDIYTCEPVSRFDNIDPTCLFAPNGKDIYVTFKNDLPRLNRIKSPKSYHIQNDISKQQMIGRHHFLALGFNKIYQYDNSKVLLFEYSPGRQNESILSDDHPIVKLRIEPWLIYSPIKSGFCLDPDMKRVLFIGHYTVQIWIFNDATPRLQYIWCRPMRDKLRQSLKTTYATIENATLRKSQDGRYTLELRCQVNDQDQIGFSKVNHDHPSDHTIGNVPPGAMAITRLESKNQFKFDLLLPNDNEFGTYSIVSNASKSLGFLAYAERLNWIQISSGNVYPYFRTLLTQCQSIVSDAIHKNPHVFNQIVEGQSPLEILIKADCSYADKLIKEHLKTDKHIPRFHDVDRTKSALARAISLGKTEVVHSLLKYYCRRCEENPVSWTITVVPAFASLRTVYPDFALEFVRRISYLPVRDDIVRTDHQDIYSYAKIEELEYESKENMWQRIMTLWSKGEREFDRQVETATEFVRIPHKTHAARECVVPLPDFTVYKPAPKSIQKPVETSRVPILRLIINYLLYRKNRSPFIKEVLSGRYEMFGEPAMEAVINFKWRKFAQWRAFLMLAIYAFYASAFLIGVSMKEGSYPLIRQVAMLIVLAVGSGYFGLELMQMMGQLESYWFSPYNWLDLARSVFPMVVAEQYLRGVDPSPGIRGTAMMFVYVNLILHFRVFRAIGIPIFIIFQIFKKVGEYSSIDNIKGRDMVIMIVVFSFFTTIILLNILIALMSDVVNETKLSGKQVWLKQKAEVIAEIEMYIFTPGQRKRKDYFPSLIYYIASPDEIKSYKKKENSSIPKT
ncbi:3494_t:CDS:2 [Funneliformis geosporum]|uniref:12986_t:CDS:1 n=1 Tax=Funneliformis geosporum TaxID=1117311 RepID=A0A9W4SR33_9GLOM|nr:12986_t:CDS:2 [Funneliformis geosporum]CAI2178710.1 3494_t:CDS:2 [Funneliformis geosporum]